MTNCNGDIKLGTACSKCLHCAKQREELPDGYYWALPHGDQPYANWVILELEGAYFWQTQSDAAVGPWNIKRISERIRDPREADPLFDAALALRRAQRAYMADRGNDELGRNVATAAAELDLILDKIKSPSAGDAGVPYTYEI